MKSTPGLVATFSALRRVNHRSSPARQIREPSTQDLGLNRGCNYEQEDRLRRQGDAEASSVRTRRVAGVGESFIACRRLSSYPYSSIRLQTAVSVAAAIQGSAASIQSATIPLRLPSFEQRLGDFTHHLLYTCRVSLFPTS